MSAEQRINIVQGDYYVSDDPNVVISTLLGSCVAACLYDPLARIGGMNHFLLPGQVDSVGSSASERLGVHLMELLVNGLLKRGAGRDRLQAKIFGGAKTVKGLTDIGATNGKFARAFLEHEGIPLTGISLGGNLGRRIQYWPASGRARQQFMSKQMAEPVVIKRQVSLPPVGDVELF